MASSWCPLAALHNDRSAKEPDSSDDLENKVKDDEQASEDVEGVKEENVVKSLLRELAGTLPPSLPLS
eukprot:scaffold26338_cov49-Attheya_sp.AAC.7